MQIVIFKTYFVLAQSFKQSIFSPPFSIVLFTIYFLQKKRVIPFSQCATNSPPEDAFHSLFSLFLSCNENGSIYF